MGILNSKTRVLDTMLTLEGRRQLAAGKMRIEHAIFTDADTFYEADAVSGSSDASVRIFLEACHLPQDSITFESDDQGKIRPFRNHSGLGVLHGKVLSGSVSGSNDQYFSLVTDHEQFENSAHRLLSSSIENFNHLYSIGTINSLFDDEKFSVSNNTITFQITDDKPFNNNNSAIANVNHLERFMEDSLLSNVQNYQYLPPANKVHGRVDMRDPNDYKRFRLASFPHKHWEKKLTYKNIARANRKAQKAGFSQNIKFDPTSYHNSLFAQVFEIHAGTMTKLDVIDFGGHSEKNSSELQKHVFFVGKIVVDDFDTHSFIHLFTLTFE